MKLASYALDRWHVAPGGFAEIADATTGETVALASSDGLDFGAMLDHARRVGGPALRAATFHERADLLKRLAQHLGAHKEALHALSLRTGATRRDGEIDIDGGIGTLFVFASKGRRELPNATFLIDGEVEPLSRGGLFVGRHVMVSRTGVAVQINAFNFPCWGLLEKLAPAILAGIPVVAKPATQTAYLAEALARLIVEARILPAGAFQFVAGSTGDLMDHLGPQDVMSFTGSAETSERLQRHPAIARHSVRFVAERDSLNAAILGPDAAPGAPEFDLFVKEVVQEMTVKAGQKCTAIRRVLAPAARVDAVIAALRERLAAVRVGHPALPETHMGPLAGLRQREDVRARIAVLRREARIVAGDPGHVEAAGADAVRGAFLAPILLHAADPHAARAVHEMEAFGPVATVMGYRDLADAVELANRGGGSLVVSLYTHDPDAAREAAFGVAPFHGRLVLIDRDCAAEQTGHGSPLPHMIHGGPGRAGGGEELGGVRAVHHHLQRVALQGSPRALAALTGAWIKGAGEVARERHPFRYPFGDLVLGQTFHSAERTITLEDVETFARFTGDTFYAHMDAEAVKGHPFFPGRVAHGYLLLSFAAGLFVDPPRGPVLANYGLDTLRFVKPVQPGDAMRVRLTVKAKQPRNDQYGEVRWDVEITTGAGETAATYDLLTMNAV